MRRLYPEPVGLMAYLRPRHQHWRRSTSSKSPHHFRWRRDERHAAAAHDAEVGISAACHHAKMKNE